MGTKYFAMRRKQNEIIGNPGMSNCGNCGT
jgi:hypothetical protein